MQTKKYKTRDELAQEYDCCRKTFMKKCEIAGIEMPERGLIGILKQDEIYEKLGEPGRP